MTEGPDFDFQFFGTARFRGRGYKGLVALALLFMAVPKVWSIIVTFPDTFLGAISNLKILH
jgi:hypothetical protein